MSGTSYQPVFNQAQPYPQSPTEPRDTQYYTPETEHLRLDDDPHALPSAPQPRFMGAEASGFRDSFASSNPTLANDYPDNNFSTSALNDGGKPGYYTYTDADLSEPVARQSRSYGTSPYLSEKAAAPRRSRKRALLIGSAAVAGIVAVVVIAVYFAVIKPKNDKSSTTSGASSADSSSSGSTSGSSNSSTSSGTSNLAKVSGGDGSTVTTDEGTTFTYQNSFGGTWYYDPANPLVSAAQAQSWTPPLNESFKFGEDPIRGCVACSGASACNSC